MGLDLEKAADVPNRDKAGAPEIYDADLVDFVVCELLRFTRDKDEDRAAKRIIREVLARYKSQ